MKQKNSLQNSDSYRASGVIKAIPLLLWLIFSGNLVCLLYYLVVEPEWSFGNLVNINGFTLLIGSIVTFFSAVISNYAKTYLHGFKYHARFMVLCLLFTFSVISLVTFNHVVLLLLSWFLMGVMMSKLIGINTGWAEARQASKFTQRYFLTGSFFLSIGVLFLAFQSNTFLLSELISGLGELPKLTLILASLSIIVAAIVQSAIFPFHRWLLSAMTAPTPASALMHAGFVNGSGILLALFAPLLFASNTLDLLLIIGGLTAIIAQFTKLLQVNVKQKLACSTIAQMGFMIMQCGLGFFNAAVAHLILHGFYKAYLFLSSGEEIASSKPQKPLHIKIKPLQAVVVLVFGIVGAIVFAQLTGKGMAWDSGIFLTLIVAITVGQATYNIVKQKSLSTVQKIVIPPLLFMSGIGLYAFMYNGVTLLMKDLPMVAVPLPITTVQIVFGVVFLIGFFIMKLGVYQKVPWLYVKFMNLSQPYQKTVLMYKSKSL